MAKKLSIEEKRQNRKKLLMGILSLVLMGYSVVFALKVKERILEKDIILEKDNYIIEKSFLVRKKEFYKDENYIKNIQFMKKEWNKENDAVRFKEDTHGG